VDKHPKTGLEGLFKGIAGILQMANDIAVRAGGDDSTPVDVRRTASTGIPGAVNVVYGASLRVGARVAPPRRRPRTLRQNARREPIIDDTREPLADLFDEGDHFLVIAELPGVDGAGVHWTLERNTIVTIQAESADRKYVKQIELPGLASDHGAVSCYANGVLELRLCKA
jgi:HSP20 family protein